MQQTIVIIDDNFSIRQILKVFLSRISKRFDKNINVFSTNNGVEGLGYIYITSPTIIIIDTTLPKYSGREVLDYLINNPKFQSTDVKVIVLQEQSQIIPLIPESFSIVNKDSDDAFQKVSDILLSCLQVSPISNSFGLINKLAEFVFINGNKNDLLNRSLDKKNIFLRIFLRIKWVWLELSTSLALTIMMLIFGRADDENISQAEIEKRTYRTKYYPSLVITTVSLTIILVNLGLFAFTQYTLYKNRLEGTRALNTMVVNSVLDDSDADPGDGVCDVKGSSGTGPCTLRAAIEEANAETDDVEIVFDIEDQIATINTSTSENATTGQTQQKTFYDSSNGAHWSFYYNGTEIEYSYSSDLVNWTTSNTLAYNTSSFSLFYKDISETPYLFLVTECNTYDVCLRRGTLSATSISFESEIIVFDGIDTELNYTKPIVSLSANNHVWVASRENKINVALDQFNNAIVRRSTNIATGTLSTWEEPSSLEIPSDSSGDLALISQVENDMVLISGNSSNHISAWKYNGSTWTETGDDYDFFNFAGFGTTGTIDTLLVNSGYVYIGGNFADVENIDGTSGGSYVTRLNISTSQFEGLGNATAKGVNGFVDDLAISGDYLYLGGSFTLAYASPSDITVNRIARIDISSIGNSFETLGNGETKGVNDWVYTLSISGDYLYLGGGFTTAYASPSNITVNHIARIDISSSGNSFEALGNDTTKGVNGAVFALTTSGDYLYLGGGFPTAYANPSNITVNHIARIDITTSGNSFEALGNASTKGVNNTVNTLAVSEDYLYLGGVFTSAFASPSNITVNRIARVDISSSGNSFEALGNHTTKGFTSGAVNALAVSGSYLYIGGTFTIANATPSNITVNRTARIDTTSSGNSFEALGNGTTKGVNNTVFALSFSGDQLYIGGNFTSAGDYSTNRLTVYKPSVTSNTQSDSKNSSISDLSGNIYLSYTKSLNNDLYLKRMDYTDSAWGEEILIYEGDVTDQNIYFDQENDKLTVFFIDNTELYYIQGNIPYEQADWDSTAKLLDTSLVNNLSVGQSTLWDYPYVVYTKGVETPYNIKFAEIGNPNIKTIFPELSLPVITNDKIKIDASTQQSSVCETNSLKIELDGLYAGLSSDGISLATGLSIDADVLIKGFIINNFTNGISAGTSRNLKIECNILGLGSDGETIKPNTRGISINSASIAEIGGSTLDKRNIISGNSESGISITTNARAIIQGNIIGSDKSGELSKPNGTGVIIFSDVNGNVIGGVEDVNPSSGCVGSCNLISGNTENGISIYNDNEGNRDIQILGNFIGTNITGTTSLSNGQDGVSINFINSGGVLIGGASSDARNIISGNTQNGISMDASSSETSNISIINNYLGANNTGNNIIPNSNGVNIFGDTSGSVKDVLIQNNTISGNSTYGLTFSGLGVVFENIEIKENYIGTNSTDANLSNTINGVQIDSESDFLNFVIGGTEAEEGNIIKHNGSANLNLNIKNGVVKLQNNIISNSPINSGVVIGNVYSGNGYFELIENTINNNGNYGINVEMDAGVIHRIINNTIFGHSNNAVYLDTGSAYLLGNSLYNNSLKQISLNNGANGNQEKPTLTSAEYSGTEIDPDFTNIYGSFQSEPLSYYRLEFFSSEGTIKSEGDAVTYMGFQNILTDVSGDYNFSVSPIVLDEIIPIDSEHVISSTATLCTNSTCVDFVQTSEVSNSVETTDITPEPTDTPVPTNTPEPTPTETPAPTVTNTLEPTITPVPSSTTTPNPTSTSTPVPTPTNTPIPTFTNTPIPILTNTPIPTTTSAPSNTNTPVPVPTVTPTSQTAIFLPTESPILPTSTGEITPTTINASITITPITSFTDSEDLSPESSEILPTSSYSLPEESLLNHPIVKSGALTLSKRINQLRETSPVLGNVMNSAEDFSEKIQPLTENLAYLLTLQFIGKQTAITAVSSFNILALATPAIVTAFSMPKILNFAFAWFWKPKKRKAWGILLDRIKFTPVAFARISVLKNGTILESQTSDLLGRYGFVLDKGDYKIHISHPDYVDNSHEITINQNGQTLTSDLELTPKNIDDFVSKLGWTIHQFKRFIRKNLFVINSIFFACGLIYTLYAITFAFTLINYVILGLYVIQLTVIILLHLFKEGDWGVVQDLSTREPVSGAVVRLYNEERQLDVTMTDSKGRYGFMLEPGTYYIKATAPGYAFIPENTAKYYTNKAGETLLKFTLQDSQRISLKLYMQKTAFGGASRDVIQSPFN